MLGGRFAPLEHDQEAFCCAGKTKTPLFAAVCDGMGGEAFGERASFEACSALADAAGSLGESFEANKDAIGKAIIEANERICSIMQSEMTGRMGSTLAAVLLQDDRLYYTNLGDSRIYLLRDGKLHRLTKDHTEGQTMLDAGILTAEQLKTHPSRNKLSLHLGIFPEEVSIEPAAYTDLQLAGCDRLLLCSDGVYGALEEGELISILGGSGTAEDRAGMLIDKAYGNGSRDNMTAMVIDIKDSRSVLLPLAVIGSCLALAAAAAVLLMNCSADAPGNENRTEEPQTSVGPTDT